MLDTMKLTLQDLNIKEGASLLISGGETDFQTGEIRETLLFKDSKGKEAFGAKAYLNTEKLNLTIKPIAGQVRAFVSFSAPKRFTDDNYYPIRSEQLPQVFESVESELLENGIETRINKAKLSRVDTFRNILTDEETQCYARLFGLLEANRAKDKSTHGATTWLMRNDSTEYCIYDKLEELRNSGHITEGLPKTLRFEHRCKDTAKVKGFFKMNETSVEELKRYGFNAILDRTIKAWNENFFKYDIAQIETLVESQIRNELLYFQATFGKVFFSKYLKAYGAYYLASSSGGIEIVKKALQNMESNRKKVYRAEKELKEALLLVESLRNDSTSPKTLGELYSELKYKMECV